MEDTNIKMSIPIIEFDTKPHMHKVMVGKSKEWNNLIKNTPLPFVIKRPRACKLLVSSERPSTSHFMYADGVYISEHVE